MFRLDLSPTFSATVRFRAPLKPGEFANMEFTAHFKRLTVDESEAIAKLAQAEQWTDRQLAQRLLAGWGDDVTDASGAPLPYNSETVAAVLNIGGLAHAVLQAHAKAKDDAALGN